MKKLLLIILITLTSSTFADSHLDFTLSDFCYLQPSVQDRGGVYYFPNQTKGITASSICVFKDAYGQYFSKGKLVNGKKEGNWIKWDRNGVKAFDSYYKNGKKEGKEIYIDLIGQTTETFFSKGLPIESISFNKDGQITAEATYKDGELSYETFYTYHDNGNIRMKGAKVMPGYKFDGVVTTWYENGQIENEVNYSKGKLLGKATWWYQNGQISSEDFRSLDGYVGIHRYWHENGQLSGEYDYTTGLAKHAKNWHDNGQLEFDWTYLNGKMDGEYIKLDRDGKIYYKATYKEGNCISGDCPK